MLRGQQTDSGKQKLCFLTDATLGEETGEDIDSMT